MREHLMDALLLWFVVTAFSAVAFRTGVEFARKESVPCACNCPMPATGWTDWEVEARQ